ncbi:hypothetical protein D6C78_06717 [Aureobasidium pullulans]|uniref:Uncharacterized protein n=1 Tax=Aureobasidium pullulans TaxID=5580 RepID=A0A4T0BK21_AURPU|nr:hypothetical protein D6C78_06717 [Aureobasidium pullulans]
MANQSRLLTFYITILLSLLFLHANAAPISFADVEESWKRGLSEQAIHASSSTKHPTPSWIPLILSSSFSSTTHITSKPPTTSEQNVFEGMLDERTMAVRRQSAAEIKVAGFAKMIRDVLRRGEEVEVGVEVLRPVRNRRWEFNG